MRIPEAGYVVEIDEEGYPMFSGIRSTDAELNAQIFRGLRRSDPNRISSRLMTVFSDGKLAWVDAFDDPLVVQSLEKKGSQLKLRFPGDYELICDLAELQIDFFDRYHVFLTEHKIPAVLSRKAQAALLNSPGVENILSAAKHFRNSESPAESPDFWNELFDKGEDRWEMGKVTPPIAARVKRIQKLGIQRIAVPAAGRGHEAVYLDAQGFQVSALDFSPRAREEFKKVYPNSKFEYLVEDALAAFRKNVGRWDGICEHTFYCAIPPLARIEYWESIAEGLKQNAILFGLFYLKTHPGGPPYGCTQWEIREFSKKNFEILEWEIAVDSEPKRLGEELWVVLRRR